jgi:hypothetical protein
MVNQRARTTNVNIYFPSWNNEKALCISFAIYLFHQYSLGNLLAQIVMYCHEIVRGSLLWVVGLIDVK